MRENPPDGLHEVEVHGFVIVLEVDPPSGTSDDGLPLGDVARDDGAALLVVLVDSELEDVLALLVAEAGGGVVSVVLLARWRGVAVGP